MYCCWLFNCYYCLSDNSISGTSFLNNVFNALFTFNVGLHDTKVQPSVKVDPNKAVPTIEVPALSLDELKEKTENFGSKALIGEGSYGRVYFVTLNNGKSVAVKKLDVSTEAESNNEFLTQVNLLFSNLNKNNFLYSLNF